MKTYKYPYQLMLEYTDGRRELKDKVYLNRDSEKKTTEYLSNEDIVAVHCFHRQSRTVVCTTT